MSGACSTYGERRCACRGMVGRAHGKRQLLRPRRRWENNIKMDVSRNMIMRIELDLCVQDRVRGGLM